MCPLGNRDYMISLYSAAEFQPMNILFIIHLPFQDEHPQTDDVIPKRNRGRPEGRRKAEKFDDDEAEENEAADASGKSPLGKVWGRSKKDGGLKGRKMEGRNRGRWRKKQRTTTLPPQEDEEEAEDDDADEQLAGRKAAVDAVGRAGGGEKAKKKKPAGRREEDYFEEPSQETVDRVEGDDAEEDEDKPDEEEEEVVEDYPDGITDYVPPDRGHNCMVRMLAMVYTVHSTNFFFFLAEKLLFFFLNVVFHETASA